jgi:CRISPR/Cas system-associated protein Csm6
MVATYNPHYNVDSFDTPVRPVNINKHIDSDASADSEDIDGDASHLVETLRNPENIGKDFSRNETMRKKIEKVYYANPRAFGYELKFLWENQEETETLISHLKEQFKIQDAQSNDAEIHTSLFDQLMKSHDSVEPIKTQIEEPVRVSSVEKDTPMPIIRSRIENKTH